MCAGETNQVTPARMRKIHLLSQLLTKSTRIFTEGSIQLDVKIAKRYLNFSTLIKIKDNSMDNKTAGCKLAIVMSNITYF